jgi:hypothetical protein
VVVSAHVSPSDRKPAPWPPMLGLRRVLKRPLPPTKARCCQERPSRRLI